jgi:DHA2 family multidrug resistance protein
MPKEKNNAIAGLVNFMRNIGASVGTSVVTTVLARRDQFHQERLGSNITPGNLVLKQHLNGLSHQLQQSGMSAHDAINGAYGRFIEKSAIAGVYPLVHRHILAADAGRRHPCSA